MITALQIIQIIFQSVAIIFMISFMFIGIWSFIAFLRFAKNQRVQIFLLEKINKSISSLEKSLTNNTNNLDTDFLMEDSISNTEDNNIIKFDDNIK